MSVLAKNNTKVMIFLKNNHLNIIFQKAHNIDCHKNTNSESAKNKKHIEYST